VEARLVQRDDEPQGVRNARAPLGQALPEPLLWPLERAPRASPQPGLEQKREKGPQQQVQRAQELRLEQARLQQARLALAAQQLLAASPRLARTRPWAVVPPWAQERPAV
jgi:hypothetical protein